MMIEPLDLLEQLGAEIRRRSLLSEQDPIQLLSSPAYVSPKQAHFLRDSSSRKSLLSGRRNGKSFCFARQLFLIALTKPGSSGVFVGITRQSAKDIIWLELLALCERLNLSANVDHTTLRIKLSNGSTIRVTGCSDTADQARFRGVANDCVCLDEMQDWPAWLNKFVREVIEPTLIDRNGMLCLGGTPNERLFGFFYEVTGPQNLHPQYSQHHFSLYDNTFFGRPSDNTPWTPEQALVRVKEELEKAKTERGLTETHNIFISEYMGRWPTTSSNILYSDFTEDNIIEMPPIGWRMGNLILGLDPGFNDHCGFTLWSQAPEGDLTAIASWGKTGMKLDEISTELRGLCEKYKDLSIVMDEAGAGGKTMAVSWAASYSLPIRAAIKVDKRIGISMMNADFRLKNIKIVRAGCPELIRQLRSVQWDPKREREAEGQRCDEVDAALYGYRAYTIDNTPLPVKHTHVSPVGPIQTYDKSGDKTFPIVPIQKLRQDEPIQAPDSDEGMDYWQKKMKAMKNTNLYGGDNPDD